MCRCRLPYGFLRVSNVPVVSICNREKLADKCHATVMFEGVDQNLSVLGMLHCFYGSSEITFSTPA